jgi:GAF domain-containing protein
MTVPPAHPAPSELLAFVSLARLATGTPSLTDVGALAEGHLRHIAPAATLALFGLDDSGAHLQARYAAGPAADAVQGLSMRLGERLSGWVGANLRVMANGDPRLDLLEATPADLRAACAVPLVAEGALVGVLALYTATPFTADQARTVEMIAPHLATAVAAVESAGRADEPVRQARGGMRLVATRG